MDALDGIVDPIFVDMTLESSLFFFLPSHFKALLGHNYQHTQRPSLSDL